MKIYMFYHSVISDWNHGNAHFLRGMVSALQSMKHHVSIFEPLDGWSLKNLVKYYGEGIIQDFRKRFPFHQPSFYDMDNFNPEEVLEDADVVIVHEWNDPRLIKMLGDYRSLNNHFLLFFHDTHHRAVTEPLEMQKFNLQHYDGVLVFGEILKKIYEQERWGRNIHILHEAADIQVFKPVPSEEKEGDLVWIGNWGDNERTDELLEFIIEPSEELNLKTVFYGVRYPKYAIRLLEKANIEYRNWLPNYKVPEVFSRFRFTVHVPRRPYVKSLPGIPTIRPFEAMACGIPLICSTWNDSENLFTPGKDYLIAHSGEEMKQHMKTVLEDKETAGLLSEHALNTIQNRHTCEHRAKEFLKIAEKAIQAKRLIA
jgi:spore maturation protein CgeB